MSRKSAEDGATKANARPALRLLDDAAGVPRRRRRARHRGLTNPRGFIIVDKHQRNPTFRNVFALGVCVAIAPTGKTPVPVGVPKTGFMIESMVTAIAENLGAACRRQGRRPTRRPGTPSAWPTSATAAWPSSPSRRSRRATSTGRPNGNWVHLAKVAFEKYFLGKISRGESEPFYEKLALDLMGAHKLKAPATAH